MPPRPKPLVPPLAKLAGAGHPTLAVGDPSVGGSVGSVGSAPPGLPVPVPVPGLAEGAHAGPHATNDPIPPPVCAQDGALTIAAESAIAAIEIRFMQDTLLLVNCIGGITSI